MAHVGDEFGLATVGALGFVPTFVGVFNLAHEVGGVGAGPYDPQSIVLAHSSGSITYPANLAIDPDAKINGILAVFNGPLDMIGNLGAIILMHVLQEVFNM